MTNSINALFLLGKQENTGSVHTEHPLSHGIVPYLRRELSPTSVQSKKVPGQQQPRPPPEPHCCRCCEVSPLTEVLPKLAAEKKGRGEVKKIKINKLRHRPCGSPYRLICHLGRSYLSRKQRSFCVTIEVKGLVGCGKRKMNDSRMAEDPNNNWSDLLKRQELSQFS